LLPSNRGVGLIWKTTNGGINWGYQQPDTAFYNGIYNAIDFLNSATGWAYEGNGIHTTNGGGPIIFTSIKNINEIIASDYKLFQNYPNPFNPNTVIGYSLLKNGYVVLKIYDIIGKEVTTLVNKNQKAGKYEVQFSNKQLTNNQLQSGIYFYTLFVDGMIIDTKKMIFLK
jgi:hypothetical protein